MESWAEKSNSTPWILAFVGKLRFMKCVCLCVFSLKSCDYPQWHITCAFFCALSWISSFSIWQRGKKLTENVHLCSSRFKFSFSYCILKFVSFIFLQEEKIIRHKLTVSVCVKCRKKVHWDFSCLFCVCTVLAQAHNDKSKENGHKVCLIFRLHRQCCWFECHVGSMQFVHSFA